MSELDPDVRGVIRRRIEVRESHGRERLLLNHEALRALLDAADERDRLAAAVGQVRALVKGDDTRLMIGSDGIVSEVVDILAILAILEADHG